MDLTSGTTLLFHGVRSSRILLNVMSRSQGQVQYCDGASRQHRPHVQWSHLLDIPQETCSNIHEALRRTASLYKHVMGTGMV